MEINEKIIKEMDRAKLESITLSLYSHLRGIGMKKEKIRLKFVELNKLIGEI